MKIKFLMLSLCLAFAPVAMQAQVNYTVSGNQAYVAYSEGASGNIVISNTYEGYPVTSIGTNAFNSTTITGITLPDTVTNINYAAFAYCYDLTNIAIPNSVTGIGYAAFYDCYGLKNITLPASVTSLGDFSFNNCTNLLNVTVPDSVTSIDEAAFEDCSSLTNVTIGNNVTSIGDWAFDGCSSLTSLVIPAGVTSIGEAAFEETGLTNVIIPASVTSIGEAVFNECWNLTTITVSAGNPAYSSINGVLFNLNQTTLIEFPGGIGGSYTIPNSVSSIEGWAFGNCDYLTNVTIPVGVTSIGENAFASSGLMNATIPASVTSVGEEAFNDCYNLTNIAVNAGNPNYSSVNGVLFDKNQTTLIQYPAGNASASYTIPVGVTSIGDGAFYDCESLTSVTIPASVASIGQAAFDYDISLTTITFLGNPPALSDPNEFSDDGVPATIVYYDYGTSGWGATYGGLNTGTQRGTLVNGGNYYGTIYTNTIHDVYTFTANKGDVINLRLGTTNFIGDMQLFGPTGAQVDGTWSNGGGTSSDLSLEDTATNSGTFTVLVSSWNSGQSGTYVLRLAQTPEPFVVPAGDDGGAMTNGANHYGAITLGDMDMWTFSANKGDVINLRLGTTNFIGDMQLFGPTGAQVDGTWSNGGGTSSDLSLEDTATNSGTFTVLVSSWNSGQSGTYVLRLAQTPEPFVVPAGDDGGAMTNGANHYGAITLGDMDMWTFSANKGDVINLRLGTTNFIGDMQLFGPTGAQVDGTWSNGGGTSSDLSLEDTATNSGTFTVLVSSWNSGQSGTYVLRLAQTPEPFVVPAGDDGGAMTNGANHYGAITLGDMDMWTFSANKGDVINLRLGTTNFIGDMQLFGPTGAQVDGTWSNGGGTSSDLSLEDTATNSGTFTVLVSSWNSGQSGTYALYYLNPLGVPAPQIGGGVSVGQGGGFNIPISGFTNQTVVIEASTNLLNWQPIWTNTLVGASTNFIDMQWQNYPNRFYRAR